MPLPIDLSERKDLGRLTDLVKAMRKAWPQGQLMLVGATARDILLSYAHGLAIERATFDIDFAFAASSWGEFLNLRAALTDSGDFAEVPGRLHQLIFKRETRLDLIPFDGVERDDRTIAWPPQQDEVMHVLGYREAMQDLVTVQLPEGQQIHSVSLPGLAALKLFAWRDRRHRSHGKDAGDLWTILSNYLQAGNEDRLYADYAHLVESPDYDYLRAGAWMLGSDMRTLLAADQDGKAVAATIQLLAAEIDASGQTALVRDMRGVSAQAAFDLLTSLFAGLSDTTAF